MHSTYLFGLAEAEEKASWDLLDRGFVRAIRSPWATHEFVFADFGRTCCWGFGLRNGKKETRMGKVNKQGNRLRQN